MNKTLKLKKKAFGIEKKYLWPWSTLPVMENSSLLFSSCHLKLGILENNRLLSENSGLFVKITSKKVTTYFPIAACYFPK